MAVVVAIAGYSVLLFAAVLFALLFLFHEIGYLIGRRQAARGVTPGEGVGVVVGGVLGLLAFILALTLNFSSTRFNERREGALAEANAIGTAWLRAQAIGEPRGAEIARLLEDYTRLRIEFAEAPLDEKVLDGINQRTNALQTQIWGNVAAIVRDRKDPVASSLMASLNDVFDMTTAQRYAFALRLPSQVFWLLIGLASLGLGALGYQLGLRGNPVRTLVILMTAVWSFLIVSILDMGSARLGNLRANTDVYEWTLQGFQGGVPIPPQPRL
ncbi:MAG: hypothetical protein JSR21_04110 [Proteobacteria bacterium]|nr:hypothetical protein [Pseudomonadota bacterium]